MKTTTAITTVKRDVKLQEWMEQIKAQQESGINVKTYYYHLRKVREQYLESKPAIVPVAVSRATSDIRIEKNDLQISLPCDIQTETLLALVH